LVAHKGSSALWRRPTTNGSSLSFAARGGVFSIRAQHYGTNPFRRQSAALGSGGDLQAGDGRPSHHGS
jgi:hypothetical protein